MKRPTPRTDVAIVGAGFAGLSAAHELSKAGIDFT
ncbi:MAG: FAD-binding protein, partial [Mesorhizobium sp.]